MNDIPKLWGNFWNSVLPSTDPQSPLDAFVDSPSISRCAATPHPFTKSYTRHWSVSHIGLLKKIKLIHRHSYCFFR